MEEVELVQESRFVSHRVSRSYFLSARWGNCEVEEDFESLEIVQNIDKVEHDIPPNRPGHQNIYCLAADDKLPTWVKALSKQRHVSVNNSC